MGQIAVGGAGQEVWRYHSADEVREVVSAGDQDLAAEMNPQRGFLGD
jgi:hypothetical protein